MKNQEQQTPKRSVMDLVGKNIVVFDLEIKNVIDKVNVGWKDFDKMGISVGCAFDYRSYNFRVFLDDNIGELVSRLNEPNTLVVAFNNVAFDNQLLRHDPLVKNNPLKPDSELNIYDMYVESNKGSGASPFSGGKRLDDHLRCMKLPLKTDDGANAPILWQKGKYGEVIDYCLQDVTREKMLFDRVWQTGMMANQFSQGKAFSVRLPSLEGL